jgi:hypothetical protein
MLCHCDWEVVSDVSQERHAFIRMRNLANNIGGGGGVNRPWVLRTLIYEGVKLEGGGGVLLTWY